MEPYIDKTDLASEQIYRNSMTSDDNKTFYTGGEGDGHLKKVQFAQTFSDKNAFPSINIAIETSDTVNL